MAVEHNLHFCDSNGFLLLTADSKAFHVFPICNFSSTQILALEACTLETVTVNFYKRQNAQPTIHIQTSWTGSKLSGKHLAPLFWIRRPELPHVFCNVWMSMQGESGKSGNSGEVGFPGSPVSSLFVPPSLALKTPSKHFRDSSHSCISGLQRFPRHSWSTWTEGSQGNFFLFFTKTSSPIGILSNAFWIAVFFIFFLGFVSACAFLNSCSNWLSQQGHGGLLGQKGETGALGSKVYQKLNVLKYIYMFFSNFFVSLELSSCAF